MKNSNPDVIQNWLVFRILNAATQESLSGSAIEQCIKQEMHRFFEFDCAFIFKVLQRLENLGWLEAEWRQIENSKREKLYSITGAGRDQLKTEWEIRQSALAQFIEEGKWPAFRPHKAKPEGWN